MIDGEVFRITSRGSDAAIDARLYRYIFENSIMADHPKYLESLETGRLSLGGLVELSRQGHISYALFFGSYDVVAPRLEAETTRLFGGFGGVYSISVRGKAINLNSIRLIIKDIKMKQAKIARFVKTPSNKHVKFLKNSPRSLSDQASHITTALDINMEVYRGFKDKHKALAYVIDKLESASIFVSLENSGTNMPQTLKRANGLTGVYIKDRKFPYFFIANEGMADFDKLPGRKVFTLTYLAACLFKGSSKLVGLNQGIDSAPGDDMFAIAELILMPAELMPHQSNYTIDDLDRIADALNVTSYAALVRIYHLEYIEREAFYSLKSELNQRYRIYAVAQQKAREDKKNSFQHNVTRNIVTYQGKAFLRILRDQYSHKRITRRELNRQLAYGKHTVDINKVFENI